MASRDSLNYENEECARSDSPKTPLATHHVDTLLQGAEMQESPRGGSVNSSVSSTSPVRRDAASIPPQAMNMPQFCATGAPQMSGHQILIDPATGQHYLVPSGPPPPQSHAPPIFYQPVYYSQPPPQPMYYQPFQNAPQGAYIMAQPMSTQTGAMNTMQMMPPHTTIAQRFSGTNQTNTVPASMPGGYAQSVADSEDVRSLPAGEDHQSFLQHRLNIQNEADSQMHRLKAKKSQSPPSSPVYKTALDSEAVLNMQRISSKGNSTVREDRCNTNPSSSHEQMQREQRPDNLGLTGHRTPLFGGAPSWWGEDPRRQRGDDDHSHTDAETSKEQGTSPSNAPQRRPMKPVRMDIDLNKPFEEEETPKEEKTKAAPRVAPTAFTVSFDTDSESKTNISLQDAARKSTTRRLLRRSGGNSNSSYAAMSLAESLDPKQYLLNKMLMGSGSGFNGAPEFLGANRDFGREVDTLSEAGTYVVDEKDRQLEQMVTSQHNDSDEDSDSDSTTTKSSDRTPSPRRSAVDLTQISARFPETPRRSSGGEESTPNNGGGALLRELVKLRPTPIPEGHKTIVAPSTPPKPSHLSNIRPCKAAAAAHLAHLATSQHYFGASPGTASSTSTNFANRMGANRRSTEGPAKRLAGKNGGKEVSSPSYQRVTPAPTVTPATTSSASASTTTLTANSHNHTHTSSAAASNSSTVAGSPTLHGANFGSPRGTTTTHSVAHSHCLAPSSASSASNQTMSGGSSAFATGNFRSQSLRVTSTSQSARAAIETVCRRGDGGRFSLRTPSSGAQPTTRGTNQQNRAVARPPFRVGGGTRPTTGYGPSSAASSKESAEMTAWLRRKDYNPMKAAAEARKMQQLKARLLVLADESPNYGVENDQFCSSRSISFHQGARVDPSTRLSSQVLGKSRYNRSQDDLLTEDGCGPETILASYSKGVAKDLSRLKIAEGSATKKPDVTEVEKSVQQLTLKCNRSIELIKNAHQGHLSESVESLLERAVQVPTQSLDTSVADQLDRLSAAFDAIQKYLEVSSTPTSVPSSPSVTSSSPVRFGNSSNSSSPVRQQRGAFRSRLVTPKRSPSGGRRTPMNV